MDEFGKNGKAPEPAYVVSIGDIAGSRRVARCADLQVQLRAELDAISRRLHDALVDRLVLIRADEIQGLFRRPAAEIQSIPISVPR